MGSEERDIILNKVFLKDNIYIAYILHIFLSKSSILFMWRSSQVATVALDFTW